MVDFLGMFRRRAPTRKLRGFARDGFAPLRAEWEASHAFAGHTIALTLSDRSEQIGVAAGVADDGALLLQTETGLRRFYSGDVSVRPARHSLRSSSCVSTRSRLPPSSATPVPVTGLVSVRPSWIAQA